MWRRWSLLFCAALATLPIAGPLAGQMSCQLSAAEPPVPLTFERDIRPIFKSHCFQCHGEQDHKESDLDMRLVRLIAKGGTSGTGLVAGDHAQSLLWQRINSGEMPPEGNPLSPEQQTLIAQWIDQGAPTARPEPEQPTPGFTEEEQAFWAFQPITRPAVPTVQNAPLVQTTIDAFLLEALEAKGLSFSAEADRRTFIRRATFDLTGLPPTVEEVAGFLADVEPAAHERVVDRLLASPAYGERWARHWLDVAGYADSDGYSTKDLARKAAYKYRDYIVRSLNANRRWDEVIREQLAGDEMLPPGHAGLTGAEADKLIATGYLRMAPDGTGDGEVDQAIARNEVIAETIKIVSTSLLGLSVGCAQCHDHRHDPILQQDYYQFRAIFEPAFNTEQWRNPQQRLVSLWGAAELEQTAKTDAEVAHINEQQTKAIQELVQVVFEREIATLPEDQRAAAREAVAAAADKRTADQQKLLVTYPRLLVNSGNVSLYDGPALKVILDKYAAEIAKANESRPAENVVHALTEVAGQIPATHVFSRGDISQPRQAVTPSELTILTARQSAPTIPAADAPTHSSGRRLAYARHLTSGQHPLVARVLVNRVWMHHFGRGIVETPADFGTLGARPTHPALLDWLSAEFMQSGWDLKHLHRIIMTSTAYRQSSQRNSQLDAVDPENRLLGRAAIRRLEAEEVRDAVLSVSGKLNATMFGAPVTVGPDETGQIVVGGGGVDGENRPTQLLPPDSPERYRRSLYIQAKRSMPVGILEVFDAPTMAPNCDRRASSTVAPQALALMNNAFVIEQSEQFAARLETQVPQDLSERVRMAWRIALAQEPEPAQLETALAFVNQQQITFAPVAQEGRSAERLALASLCQALLTSNAFLYVD